MCSKCGPIRASLCGDTCYPIPAKIRQFWNSPAGNTADACSLAQIAIGLSVYEMEKWRHLRCQLCFGDCFNAVVSQSGNAVKDFSTGKQRFERILVPLNDRLRSLSVLQLLVYGLKTLRRRRLRCSGTSRRYRFGKSFTALPIRAGDCARQGTSNWI